MGESETAERGAQDGRDELSQLMVAYQNGQMSAFESLYARLASDLRGYLTALSWKREKAEDLLQETFLQLHRARHPDIPPRPVRPWIFAIARHCYLMDLRVFARKRSRETSTEDGTIDIPVPPPPDSQSTCVPVVTEGSGLNTISKEASLAVGSPAFPV